MRIVLDTNVLISAIVANGVSRRLLDQWRIERAYELVVCPMLLEELFDVLSRERLERYITLDEVGVLIDFLRAEAVLCPDPTEIEAVTPDPDDNYLVALARQQRASILVTGDRHFESVALPGLTVLTPAAALARLRR